MIKLSKTKFVISNKSSEIYESSSFLVIKIGQRNPNIIKNYIPYRSIYLLTIQEQQRFPVIQIVFNGIRALIDLNKQYNPNDEHIIQLTQTYQLIFTAEFFSSSQTHKLYTSYIQQQSQSQKHYISQGIQNFIRSQKQFLILFQRNTQIQQLKQNQYEQRKLQKQLYEEIIMTKKYKIDKVKIIILFIFFFIIGYLFGQQKQIDNYNYGKQKTIIINKEEKKFKDKSKQKNIKSQYKKFNKNKQKQK